VSDFRFPPRSRLQLRSYPDSYYFYSHVKFLNNLAKPSTNFRMKNIFVWAWRNICTSFYPGPIISTRRSVLICSETPCSSHEVYNSYHLCFSLHLNAFCHLLHNRSSIKNGYLSCRCNCSDIQYFVSVVFIYKIISLSLTEVCNIFPNFIFRLPSQH
jgi:hypothetical protein